jgi:hypothetical protein
VFDLFCRIGTRRYSSAQIESGRFNIPSINPRAAAFSWPLSTVSPAYRRKCDGSLSHSSSDVAVVNDAARLLRRRKASPEKAAMHAVKKGGDHEHTDTFRSLAPD